MASYNGTMGEFHTWVGPAIRNLVAAYTRKARLKRGGVCEACGQVRELHSVHPTESGRRQLIEQALAGYLDKDGLLRIPDLAVAIKEVMAMQRKVEYLWLCRPDHDRYHRGELTDFPHRLQASGLG